MNGVLLANLAYLIAAVLFILGVKGMTHPRTAVRGNLMGSLGMLIAVAATLGRIQGGPILVILGLAVGSAIGAWLAVQVKMTQMPQLVGLFNGFGGGASVLVAGAELLKGSAPAATGELLHAARLADLAAASSGITVAGLAAAATGLVGAVTFFGSLVACGKLHEMDFFRKPFSFDGHQWVNAGLLAVALLLALWMASGSTWVFVLLVLVGALLGVLLVLPIGGADMPVVIALLNSYSGLAAAGTGFVINNTVLIIAGSLVGASGIILTQIMCKAMNRSLPNVLFGAHEASGAVADADSIYAGKVKSTSADEVAMILSGAQRVLIIPGYGLAVAQAQHAVRELANLLEANGTSVEYGIHPVAGRMPGHMNVLLAEADVPYEQLKEMDEVNSTMSQCDVAIVIGANDVVNPVAKQDAASPIAGMPIIEVDKARTAVVIKRSLSPGFAGIPNPLFAADNCLMLFGDGKQAMLDLVAAVKEA